MFKAQSIFLAYSRPKAVFLVTQPILQTRGVHKILRELKIKIPMHEWPQKKDRLLFQTVWKDYLETGQNVDWMAVAKRVRVFSATECKDRFYYMQDILRDSTDKNKPMWGRVELEEFVIKTIREELDSLRETGNRSNLDWGIVAKKHAPGRTPEECKRAFHNLRHLCRPSMRLMKLRLGGSWWGVILIGSMVGFLPLIIVLDKLFYAFSDDEVIKSVPVS
ncbi:hypothetical protein GGI25_005975 [Coemansia spiralis]|uniref:Uncharacterized protein n=2 Tax=Coemansia TaxID=4863 RepID=A0A9W8KVY6_9FUNG|nr:hypothetical protein BX070DRAFT_254821 [Coemansia spiralis]KAJ1991698.1 hypothetical protein EDC05_003323 [Coemansia umbellata]KAJ2619116.1 hypothetical protein GGI26_006081 [Coemansia sp. RSA 1358]KAJ2670002.1 hypothetical protein GGI25_005975 [Coemansia spiralis]